MRATASGSTAFFPVQETATRVAVSVMIVGTIPPLLTAVGYPLEMRRPAR